MNLIKWGFSFYSLQIGKLKLVLPQRASFEDNFQL